MLKQLCNYFGYRKDMLTAAELSACQTFLEKTRVSRDYWYREYEEERSKNEALLKLYQKIANVPDARVDYRRQYIGPGGKILFGKMPVTNFILNREYMIEDMLQDAGLKYTGKENLNLLIPEIYQLAQSVFGPYTQDPVYGFSEIWFNAWEFRQNGFKGDCEDRTHWIMQFFRQANIPADMVLATCGEANAGYGHNAPMVYSQSSKKWHLMNSTSPAYDYGHVQDYPAKGNTEDPAMFKEHMYYFSYNWIYSLHEFESKEAETQFNTTLGKYRSKIPVISIQEITDKGGEINA